MSHFARKVLGPNPPRYVYQVDARGATDSEAPLRAVYGKTGFVQGHEPAPQEFEVRPSLRLHVWCRGTPEEHRDGRKGWLPILMAGTNWDEAQLRLQYKAQGVCTLFLKAGLENNAS